MTISLLLVSYRWRNRLPTIFR